MPILPPAPPGPERPGGRPRPNPCGPGGCRGSPFARFASRCHRRPEYGLPPFPASHACRGEASPILPGHAQPAGPPRTDLRRHPDPEGQEPHFSTASGCRLDEGQPEPDSLTVAVARSQPAGRQTSHPRVAWSRHRDGEARPQPGPWTVSLAHLELAAAGPRSKMEEP
jgi:hypothetical protein